MNTNMSQLKLRRLKSETEASRQPNEESNFNSSVNHVQESERELDIAIRVVKDQLNKDDDKKMTGYYAYVQTIFEPHIVELLN